MIIKQSYLENVVLLGGSQVVSDKERIKSQACRRNDDLEPMVDAEKKTETAAG